MKTAAKLRVRISAISAVLLLISALSIADAVQVLQMADGWEPSMVLLSCLLFGSAASALTTLALLFFRKSWVMRSYSIFVLFWIASGIAWDANIVALLQSEVERIVGLAIAITGPILLSFSLVRYVLILSRKENEQQPA